MKARIVLKGGKGSGNFGHSGRPGKVGGSGPSNKSGGVKSSGTTFTEDDLEKLISTELRSMRNMANGYGAHKFSKFNTDDEIGAEARFYNLSEANTFQADFNDKYKTFSAAYPMASDDDSHIVVQIGLDDMKMDELFAD